MKHFTNSHLTKRPCLAASILAFGALVGSAQAVVVINFEEVGGDVVATTSGSIVVPSTFELTFFGTFQEAGSDRIFNINGNTDRYDQGTNFLTGPNQSFNSTTGSSFGVAAGLIYFPAGTQVGSSFFPNNTFTWTGDTLASIGLGSLNSNPVTFYQAANGDSIVFTAVPSGPAVPEPTTALFGLAVTGALLHRRRRA